MYAWETNLTTRDTNRVVRPLEWGFDWLEDWIAETNLPLADAIAGDNPAQLQAAMLTINQSIIAGHEQFYAYQTPTDFRLEERHPQLYPTNVRPETLRHDARVKQRIAAGKMPKAQFLRFTSPVRTRYPENDQVNARWYPASANKQAGKPKQAIIVMPQWNADAFSHNALCRIFNRFGVSALRLSKPFHDVRRPAELERSDYAISSNIGRTITACRQAVSMFAAASTGSSSRDTSSSGCSAPVSAPATHLSPAPMTHACASTLSITPRSGWATSSGPARAPVTSALRASRQDSASRTCECCGAASAQ